MTGRNSRYARVAAIAAQVGTQIAAIIRRMTREAAAELARINRAGLSPDALAGQPRRARARLVTAALAHRHNHPHRCC
jgi:hypothetical protein